ncbi:MAG: 30S ribosomal protein S9 [Desulfobulbaceae bacterium]|nr:MAG: 30S ribosomal protein S9 [Desulfobulbaceae bacterium]
MAGLIFWRTEQSRNAKVSVRVVELQEYARHQNERLPTPLHIVKQGVKCQVRCQSRMGGEYGQKDAERAGVFYNSAGAI